MPALRPRSAAVLLLVLAALGSVRCTTFGVSDGAPADAGIDFPDGQPGADAGPRLPDGARIDASRPDATAAETCPGVPAGTSSPCTGVCATEEIASLPNGVFPYAFAYDADNFFWVEHSGGKASDGSGDKGVLKRRRHDGAGGVATLLTNIDKAPRYATIASGAIWLARDPAFSERVLRVPVDCAAPCMMAGEIGGQQAFHSITPYQLGVAVGGQDTIVVFDGMGTPSPPLNLPGLGPGGDLATVDGRLIAGTSRADSPFLEVFGGTGERWTLPTTLPNGTGTPRGVTEIAADCKGVWAIETFDLGHLLAKAARGAAPVVYAIADKGLPFALEADSTHAYLGIPNAGGLYRVDGPKLTELTQGNVWSVAVTADWLYYDDHASRRILRRRK